uniref:DNA Primase n=1 Tax=Florenciella sp. virus SA2 TaxID=3240092 RepID=A0AB39JFM9_9VIRU
MSLDKHLKKYITKDKSLANYIKIGDKDENVFGNKYYISPDNLKSFKTTYIKEVFTNNCISYLVERQLSIGKFAIDLDFRYSTDVTQKQHTINHINDFIEACLNIFNDIFDNISNKQITFYILEKEEVNREETITKDGIHIIINIISDYATKLLFRNLLIEQLKDIWDDLPLLNDWENVVDEAVVKGTAGWQLYGSQKPGKLCYKLKHIFETTILNDNIDIKELDLQIMKLNDYFDSLLIRDTTNCNNFKLNELYLDEYNKINSKLTNKSNLKISSKSKCNQLQDIKNVEDLDSMIDNLFKTANDYKIKELHDYTMALTEDYWGNGSYDKWIRVCWALKNTSEKMILTWLKFCSQIDNFDFENNNVLDYWENSDINNELTYKSIIYWVKTCNPKQYKIIYNDTVDYYIYYSFKSHTECDLANTLHNMFKTQFACAGIGNNTWYEFKNNRWEINDNGSSLRLHISTTMYKKYEEKLFAFQNTITAKQNNVIVQNNNNHNELVSNNMANTIVNEYNDTSNDDHKDFITKRNEMSATCKLLKKTSTKNNILRECQELFWDQHFHNKLDKNPYLLGCTNCVIDFKEKTYRKGKHDDYISKSTNLIYKPISYYQKNQPHIINDIEEFMKQLFPDIIDEKTKKTDSSLREYMWNHMASTLLGTNENQTFNIYNGSGANGKSKLVELMSLVLGEYKGTVPISLITQKRTNIGSTSSEIYNLIGTRYAVMQEPSKNDTINEGIMKELTGGDPIQCRALFKDSVTFIPHFKLVVCTNTMFDIKSNDDGTWRRLRKVDFNSKFIEKPYEDPKFPVDDYKYQYKIDKKLDEKFKQWAPVLLSMLTEIAYETQGRVTDVEPVLMATQQYRDDQDILLEFHNTMINNTPHPEGYGIKQREIVNKFNAWYRSISDGKIQVTGKDVMSYLAKMYGKYPSKTGWTNFTWKEETSYHQNKEGMDE